MCDFFFAQCFLGLRIGKTQDSLLNYIDKVKSLQIRKANTNTCNEADHTGWVRILICALLNRIRHIQVFS